MSGLWLFVYVLPILGGCVFISALIYVFLRVGKLSVRGAIILLVTLLFVAGATNWFACRGVAASLGGSALNGRIEGHKHFLRDHSRLVQVSPETFWRLRRYEYWSNILGGVGFWTFFGVAIAMAIWFRFESRRRRL